MISFEAKQRIVLVFLTVIAVWPPVHHVLVRMTDLGPWKGAAWSMYCVPGRAIRVAIVSEKDDRPLPLGALTNLPPAFQLAHREFVDRRKALGSWAEPDELARAVFWLFPEEDAIAIMVEQAGVERASAKLFAERFDRYEYHRGTLLQTWTPNPASDLPPRID